jgi:hypothetical protein
MFWKGMGDDQRIFYSWMDAQPDLIWQPGRQIVYTVADTGGMSLKAVFTDHHLGAVVRNDTVFVAWKGMKGDKGVLFSTQQPGDVDWSGEIRVSNVTSSTGPAMAQMDGRVFMAWKGEPGDEGLSFSSLG